MTPTSLHASFHRRGNGRRLDNLRNDDIAGLGVALDWPRLRVTDNGLTRPENQGLNKYSADITTNPEIEELKRDSAQT